MTREEAEKKVSEYGSSCWMSGSNDDCVDKKYKKAQEKLRQELIDALEATKAKTFAGYCKKCGKIINAEIKK